jgi:hypothetical protein
MNLSYLPRIVRKELFTADIDKLKKAYEKVVEVSENHAGMFLDFSSTFDEQKQEDFYLKTKMALDDIMTKKGFDAVVKQVLLAEGYCDAPIEIFKEAEEDMRKREITQADEKSMGKTHFFSYVEDYLEAVLEKRDPKYIAQWREDIRDQGRKMIQEFAQNYREGRKRRGLPS